MSKPSMPFSAGFVVGVRSAWNLLRWVHLEKMRTDNQADYDAGFRAGQDVAKAHTDVKTADELLPLVQEAWMIYSGGLHRG